MQRAKMGNTPVTAESIRMQFSDNWFIPSSALAELRRQAVNALASLRHINYRQERNRMPETRHSFPKQELTYLGNVMNARAAAFYHDHGVKHIEPALEKKQPEHAILMFCKHCLRYSMGWCPKHHQARSPFREPYFLVSSDGRKFRLEFDCKICQMKVLDEK